MTKSFLLNGGGREEQPEDPEYPPGEVPGAQGPLQPGRGAGGGHQLQEQALLPVRHDGGQDCPRSLCQR